MVKSKYIAEIEFCRCVACSICVDVCPKGAILIERGGNSEVDPEYCIGCGKCKITCPAHAIIMKIRE